MNIGLSAPVLLTLSITLLLNVAKADAGKMERMKSDLTAANKVDLITTPGEFTGDGVTIKIERKAEGVVSVHLDLPNSDSLETSERASSDAPFWVMWDPSVRKFWFAVPGAIKKWTFEHASGHSSTKGERYSLKEGVERLSPPPALRDAILDYLRQTNPKDADSSKEADSKSLK